MELNLRQELQERLVASVASRESEQLKRFEEFMELKQRQEYQSMRDMMEREYGHFMTSDPITMVLLVLMEIIFYNCFSSCSLKYPREHWAT